VRRPGDERGAAAVEFALVVPVLLILVFGIIDYGLYFSDSLSARTGIAAAARQGAVERCHRLDCLATYAKDQIDPIAGGATYVKIEVVQVDPPNRNNDWQVGNDLRVCAVTVVDGITGFTPMPQHSTTRSRATMRIEQDTGARPASSYEDPLPSELGDWSFCA
jgi:Flp pilus assembly protein TadG